MLGQERQAKAVKQIKAWVLTCRLEPVGGLCMQERAHALGRELLLLVHAQLERPTFPGWIQRSELQLR